MAGLVIDTHALIWFLEASPRLSENARQRIEATVASGDTVHVASISLIEIIYLIEKGRIEPRVIESVRQGLQDPETGFALASLDEEVAAAVARIPREQVPDMPDRIVAGTALSLDVPLVSRDGKIQASDVEVIW